MNEVFISYTRNDRPKAEKLARAFESQGLSVWWDREIPAGRTFDDVIEEAIHSAQCILVLWSNESTASRWVRTEAGEGAERGALVPVLIEPDVKIPLAFRRIQAADLTDWNGGENATVFKALVEDVRAILSRSAAAGTSADPVAAGSQGRSDQEKYSAQKSAPASKPRKSKAGVWVSLLLLIGVAATLWTLKPWERIAETTDGEDAPPVIMADLDEGDVDVEVPPTPVADVAPAPQPETSGSLSQTVYVGNAVSMDVLSAARVGSAPVAFDLTLMTNCYNTKARIRGAVDFTRRIIIVGEYTHFAAKTAGQDQVTGNGTAVVRSVLKTFALWQLTVDRQGLIVEQVENPCGSVLRIESGNWARTNAGSFAAGPQSDSGIPVSVLSRGQTAGPFVSFDLTLFTPCYNTEARIRGSVDFDRNVIRVGEYTHFSSQATNDQVTGNGTQAVRSQDKTFALWQLSVQQGTLIVQQVENPCGSRLSVKSGTWGG